MALRLAYVPGVPGVSGTARFPRGKRGGVGRGSVDGDGDGDVPGNTTCRARAPENRKRWNHAARRAISSLSLASSPLAEYAAADVVHVKPGVTSADGVRRTQGVLVSGGLRGGEATGDDVGLEMPASTSL